MDLPTFFRPVISTCFFVGKNIYSENGVGHNLYCSIGLSLQNTFWTGKRPGYMTTEFPKPKNRSMPFDRSRILLKTATQLGWVDAY